MPRVISGTAKRIVLESVNGIDTRPTSDRVKESVFNILALKTENSDVLDLYAGTGQMGIEALSRGCKSAVFIDNSYKSVSCIKKNLKKTSLYEKARVIKANAISGLLSFDKSIKFDIVFSDPPYNEGLELFLETVKILTERDLIKKGGIMVFEHSKKDMPPEFVMNLKLKRSCNYGRIMVSFYENIG